MFVRKLAPVPRKGGSIRAYPPRPDRSGGTRITRGPGFTIRQPGGGGIRLPPSQFARRAALKRGLLFGSRFMIPMLPPLVAHPGVGIGLFAASVLYEAFNVSYRFPGTPAGFNLPGDWTRCANPNEECSALLGPPTHYRRITTSSCVSLGSCPTGQAFNMTGEVPAQVLSSTRTLIYGTPSQIAGRYNLIAQFVRPSTGDAPYPEWVPGSAPRVVSPPRYWPEPDYAPLRLPSPAAVPYSPPVRDPFAPPRGRPRPRPYQRPSIDLEASPGPGRNPVVRPQPGLHNQVPPGPGEKEKKTKADYGIAGRLYGAATEVKDFLDCFAKNLQGYRCGTQDGLHMYAECIYRNFHRVNAGGVIRCLAEQQIQDAAIGKLSGGASRAYASRMGSYAPKGPGSVGTGQWTWRLN